MVLETRTFSIYVFRIPISSGRNMVQKTYVIEPVHAGVVIAPKGAGIRALKDIPKIRLADEAAYYLSLGQSVTTSGLPKSGQLRIYNSSQQFIGLGEVTEDGKISPKRLINIG